MENPASIRPPKACAAIAADMRRLGFDMGSEPALGCLLRTLAASKPRGRFLELGTGAGLASAWLLDGMCAGSSLVSIDNDPALLEIAMRNLGADKRLTLICADGDAYLSGAAAGAAKFDFIFADTWAGKYRLLDEALALLDRHGFFVIDDMLPKAGWPEGHAEKAAALLDALDQRDDLLVTRMGWSCGVAICVAR